MKVSFKQGKGDNVWDHGVAQGRVINDLHAIYDLASVGYISDSEIRKKMGAVWRMRREKMKGRFDESRSKKGRGRKKRKIEEVGKELFDVIDDKKTDEVEADFVLDQRAARKMWIGTVTEDVVKYIPEDADDLIIEKPEHHSSEEEIALEDDDVEDEEIAKYRKFLERKEGKEKRKKRKVVQPKERGVSPKPKGDINLRPFRVSFK